MSHFVRCITCLVGFISEKVFLLAVCVCVSVPVSGLEVGSVWGYTSQDVRSLVSWWVWMLCCQLHTSLSVYISDGKFSYVFMGLIPSDGGF